MPIRRIGIHIFASSHGMKGLAVAMAVVIAGLAAGAEAGNRYRYSSIGLPSWSVALHMHASLSEGTGSMAWHADKAQQYGLDALWWTDHDWRVSGTNHTRRFDFETGTLDLATLTLTEPDDAYPGDHRKWERLVPSTASHEVAIVDSVAFEGTRALRVKVWDPISSPTFEQFTYTQTGSRIQNKYGLATHLRLRFAVKPETLDPSDGRIFVNITLSDHPDGPRQLRYVIGSTDGEPASTFSLPYTSGQWNSYDLDLVAAAIFRFTMGGADSIEAEDNSLVAVEIGAETRNGSEVVFFFDDLQYNPDPALDGPVLMDWTRTASNYYETVYPGPKMHVGTEISWFRAQPHMNGYAPSLQLVDYTGYGWADTLYYAVDQIHAQDGVVALNHMYGVGVYGDLEETEQQKATRIRSKKYELLGARVYGADLMEVGYRWRHGIDTVGHMEVWDAMTGNAIFTTGNGVSDSHGTLPFHGWGPFIPGNPDRENNFVTWLFAPTLSDTDLIDAMLAGRAYFGDPYEFGWESEINLYSTDGFSMGSVVVTDLPSHDVVVEIDGLPAGADVRLLQGEIRVDPPSAYLDINWIRDEFLPAVAGSVFVDTVTIDTTTPSYVRVEVHDVAGLAIAFTNPVHFLTEVPAEGVRAPRVAANVNQIRVLSARDLTLRDTDFIPWPIQFTMTVDEDAPGLGTLEVDVSAIGAPTSVTGASTWYHDAGIVTMAGFAGTGSQVSIHWSGLDAGTVEASRPLELALEPGRPNPFGRGLVSEFALPDPAFTTLEVLDVQGRRVRILLDERRDAGVHRVAWDGKDHYGHSVAGGVYFLRLRAGGRSLTTKAVKLR